MLIILKATDQCNLACRYCSNDHGDCGGMITAEVAGALLEQLPAALAEGETVNVLWHGGEPTLIPVELFEEIQPMFAARLKGHPINTMIQTNAAEISPRWMDSLLRFDVAPGISLDGPQSLHDSVRRTKEGKPSYERVVQNVRAMADAGLAVSLLCVVREEHTRSAGEIVRWVKDLGLPVRFNPVIACGRSSESLSHRAYFQFLRDISVLFSESAVDVRVEPLAWMIECLILGGAVTECSFSGTCGASIITLFPDGGIGPCGRSQTRYGNILTSPLSEILCGEERLKLLGRNKRMDGLCRGCAIRAWCGGGCPEANGDSPEAEYCSERRAFFSWLSSKGALLFQQSLLKEKTRLKDELSVLTEARAELARYGNV